MPAAMHALIAGFRKAGVSGLFVCLASGAFNSPGLSQKAPPWLKLDETAPPPAMPSPGPGQNQSPPQQKSPLPPLRIEVQKAEAAFDERTKEPVVTITMSPRSGRMFHELTLKNIGRRVILRIDGRVVAEPIIREPIVRGVVQISGSMTVKDAADLAARLSKGEAKVEIEVAAD